DQGEISYAFSLQSGDQIFGDSAQPETADHDGGAILNILHRLGCIFYNFVHELTFESLCLCGFLLLLQLDKHSVRGMRMQESNERAAFTFSWCLINEPDPLLFQIGKRAVKIIHKQTNVMDGLAFLFQETGHSSVRFYRLHEFDMG